MIVFEKFGHTFKIKNDDWKNLRARYSPKNATKDKVSGICKINKDCTFCLQYSDCKECAFGILGNEGCTVFFNKMFRKQKFDASSTSLVTWLDKDNILVRRQLNRLQKIMDEIEKENQNETKEKLTPRG